MFKREAVENFLGAWIFLMLWTLVTYVSLNMLFKFEYVFLGLPLFLIGCCLLYPAYVYFQDGVKYWKFHLEEKNKHGKI